MDPKKDPVLKNICFCFHFCILLSISEISGPQQKLCEQEVVCYLLAFGCTCCISPFLVSYLDSLEKKAVDNPKSKNPVVLFFIVEQFCSGWYPGRWRLFPATGWLLPNAITNLWWPDAVSKSIARTANRGWHDRGKVSFADFLLFSGFFDWNEKVADLILSIIMSILY